MKEKLPLTVVRGSSEEQCSTLATASSPPKLKGICKIRRYPANVLHISSLSHGISAERTEYSCDLITERHTSMSIPHKYIPTMEHFAHRRTQNKSLYLKTTIHTIMASLTVFLQKKSTKTLKMLSRFLHSKFCFVPKQ
jgi:hypothetical protein